LDALKRKKIADLISSHDKADDDAWKNTRYRNEICLIDYITNYPAGKQMQDAKDRLEFLKKERERKNIEKNKILSGVRENSNIYSPSQIISFLSEGIISTDDLQNCGIPKEIVENLKNIHQPQLQLGKTPEYIPYGYTEVYFWGIPGSGKTCALAAILSTSERAGYLDFATAQGYDYMTKLKNIFFDGKAILPPPSPVETTQYLTFTLKRTNEKHSRSVSILELSGEVFQCFHYINAGMEFPSQSHQDTFDSLIRFLSGTNRKIHFFFIDYDKGNKKDANDYTQGDYLAAASRFFKNNDVFGKTADAVYIILTKSDLMPCPKTERVEHAKKHLIDNNFSAFINTLKDLCVQYSINAGKLTIEPFSLGEVYFQQICYFDKSSALSIIDILFDRIQPRRTSNLDIFNFKPINQIDLVHFSVSSPPAVQPNKQIIVDVWAHLEQQRAEVASRVQQASIPTEAPPVIRPKGPFKIERGTLLFVRLKFQDLIVEPAEDVILWEGEIGNASFVVSVPADTAEGVRIGSVTVHCEEGLQIARIPLQLLIKNEVAHCEPIEQSLHRVRKAFVSYAGADLDEVLSRIQGMQKIIPDLDVFLDVVKLRSGEDWEKRLWTVIPESDVFYLFWSAAAKESPWVEKEWRCALTSRGIDFIDPVPLVSPKEVPPPEELAKMHFNDWSLAYKRGKPEVDF